GGAPSLRVERRVLQLGGGLALPGSDALCKDDTQGAYHAAYSKREEKRIRARTRRLDGISGSISCFDGGSDRAEQPGAVLSRRDRDRAGNVSERSRRAVRVRSLEMKVDDEDGCGDRGRGT